MTLVRIAPTAAVRWSKQVAQPEPLGVCQSIEKARRHRTDVDRRLLAKSTEYRVLRRLAPRETFTRSNGQSTKTGVLIDVEIEPFVHRA